MSKSRISPVTIKRIDANGEVVTVKKIVPSPEEVKKAGTNARRGGWSAKQLGQWGVPWPPPKGWRKDLERCHRAGEEYVPPPKPGRYPGRGALAADMAAMKARNAAKTRASVGSGS